MSTYILGIESSCDDTSAAILQDDTILANVIANQDVHMKYGGVVPELASRSHQQNIVPVIHRALQEANISKKQLSAIAFTRGPGLMGSLLVGTSFAKAFAMGLNIPLIEIDHLQAHILAHFVQSKGKRKAVPKFPFLCLTVSGGHSQIVRVEDHFKMTLLGKTIDDAAGEAFDKTAKIMGLDYPGGPIIDKLSKEGNPKAFSFPIPQIKNLDYSFSGIKTKAGYIYKQHKGRIKVEDKAGILSSFQYGVVFHVIEKLRLALSKYHPRRIICGGGVVANSFLRSSLVKLCKQREISLILPQSIYCSDNGAAVAGLGFYVYNRKIRDRRGR